MRVIAIIDAHNEERFIANCLDHYNRNGIDVYLIDDGSVDNTVLIAREFLNHNLLHIELNHHTGAFELERALKHKERLAHELDADWFIHADVDEVRLPPTSTQTLKEAIARVDAAGYNAVNFLEFTFIPTLESPDHDHADYQQSMRWYYPFLPSFPHRLNAWKKQPQRVNLADNGGHKVTFPGLSIYPESFKMRHYLYLSRQHAIHKYLHRRYPAEGRSGSWHGWRRGFTEDLVQLPSQKDMRPYSGDDDLDGSNPRKTHFIQDIHTART